MAKPVTFQHRLTNAVKISGLDLGCGIMACRGQDLQPVGSDHWEEVSSSPHSVNAIWASWGRYDLCQSGGATQVIISDQIESLLLFKLELTLEPAWWRGILTVRLCSLAGLKLLSLSLHFASCADRACELRVPEGAWGPAEGVPECHSLAKAFAGPLYLEADQSH